METPSDHDIIELLRERAHGQVSIAPNPGSNPHPRSNHAGPSTNGLTRPNILRGPSLQIEQVWSQRPNHGADDAETSAVGHGLQGELSRVITKRGWLTPDPLRSTALFVEEAGESLQAALDLTRTTVPRTPIADLRESIHLYTEVEQAVALGLMLLINIHRAIKELKDTIHE